MRARTHAALLTTLTLISLPISGCIPPVEDDGDTRVVIRDGCGDGACGADETATSCPSDCPGADLSECGDEVCDEDETATSCPQDCDGPNLDWCFDGECDPWEDPMSCPQDCGATGTCGDGTCDPDEDVTTCLSDCQGSWCFDGECDPWEDPVSCPQDCQTREDWCGDGVCDLDETTQSCPGDCAPASFCGDGTCDADETTDSCPGDCPPACARQCDGKTCGPDGCGGVCGTCSGGEECNAAGACELPALPPESFSYTVTHDANGPRAGAVVQVTSGATPDISCSMDTGTDFAVVEMTEGDHTLRLYISSSPITFCAFNTSDFDSFTYVDAGGPSATSYGIDSLGNTSSLALTCSRRNNATRLEGSFSSGRLFAGRNSSARPRENVQITGGAFSCDLN